MPRLRFSAGAKADLESIAAYIAEHSDSRIIAERFTSELRRKCADLAAAPIRMGRARNELRAGLRSHPYKSYVIFFRYVGDVLEIVNVIEGHRDIPALFGEGVQRWTRVRPDMKVVFFDEWETPTARLKGATGILRALAGLAEKGAKAA